MKIGDDFQILNSSITQKNNLSAMKKLTVSKYVLIFLFLFSGPLLAQENQPETMLNRAAQFYLGARDEVLIKVNIFGYVQRPGQYLIPRHTDLISLMAFAGGVRDGANLSEVRILRKASLEEGGNGQNDDHQKADVILVNVKDYFEKGEITQIPILEAGDGILITRTFGHKLRGIIGISSIVGLIAATATFVLIFQRL